MSGLLLILSIIFNINNGYGIIPASDMEYAAATEEMDIIEHDISHVSLFMSRSLLQCSATLQLPPQYTTYGSNVRGYYFQAPTTFAITGLTIPKDASTGLSTAAIVRFNSGPPPVYSANTNDFTQLGYWKARSENTISTGCICIENGQHIGILGYRGVKNSYGKTPYTTTINGHSVALTRMGMQYPLTTNAPKNIWQEGGPISRTHIEYTTCPGDCACLGPQCIEDIDCTGANMICSNSECRCDTGYIDNNGFCVDINECLDPNVCNNNAHCVNTIGSHICECDVGYKDTDLLNPGKTCVDFDECAEQIHNNCGINAQCNNLPGTYECVCMDGFSGDPTDECEPKPCNDDAECPSFMQCCPKKKVCEVPPQNAQSIVNALNGMTGKVNGNDIAPVSDVAGYHYILLIGVILFILINNIFIGYWCLQKKGVIQDKHYEKCNV
eukprot:98426_1